MKNLFHKYLTFIVFLFIVANSFSQNITNEIDAAFLQLQLRPPMEKLYLHTDRSTYISSDDIWFKGYLVTATNHAPVAWSKFIYVELFDKSDSLISRKKIKEAEGIFSGNMSLPKDLSEGNYFLRAYSSWMLNTGIDYVFRKTIRIENLESEQIQSQIEYSKNEDGITTATISFIDEKGKPVDKTNVKCALNLKGEKLEIFKRKTDQGGRINFDFELEDESSQSQFIEVNFEDSNKEYKHKFFLSFPENNDFDVQFFPEGGELVAGIENVIAFKAIAQNGYSTFVSGFVISSSNDTITTFESKYLGFGSFYLNPQIGRSYFAVVTDSKGIIKSFTLPTVSNGGASLSVTQIEDSFIVKLKLRDKILSSSLTLLAHSGEKLLFTQAVGELEYLVPIDFLPKGIIHFVLIDKEKHPVSSRLVFNKKPNTVSVSVNANKENYGSREAVSLSVLLQKNDTIDLKGNFSISVTDDELVQIDSLKDNIYTNLLLTSDLEGYIEDPAYYFLNDADSTNSYLDLLMLTQGWKRFNVEKVLQNAIPKAKHFLELGQTISGKYEKRYLYKRKCTQITALAINPVISKSTQTDENDVFIFNEMNFPDSTVFTIQSQRQSLIKKEPAGIIVLDKDTFPPFSKINFAPDRENKWNGIRLEKAKERVYRVGGGRMILLDEFVVTATDKTKNYEIKYGLSSTVLDAEQIAKKFPISQTAEFIVKMLPGVYVKRDNFGEELVFFGSNAYPAEIILDGMLVDLNTLSVINAEDIAAAVIIKDASAAFYSQSGGMGGVVLIELKEGSNFAYKLKGVAKYMPLGYQKSVEFYTPKYEVDSIRNSKEPDLRTTIYWNPNVEIDSLGKTDIEFYTADPFTTYSYVLEGITNRGEICRYVGKLIRK